MKYEAERLGVDEGCTASTRPANGLALSMASSRSYNIGTMDRSITKWWTAFLALLTLVAVLGLPGWARACPA